MPPVISAGARNAAADCVPPITDDELLQFYADRPFSVLTADEVRVLALATGRRGVASGGPAAAARKNAKQSAAAAAGNKLDEAEAGDDAVAHVELTDPLLFDGCQIEVDWETTVGTVEPMIGTIHFLNESSRRRGSGPSKFKPRLTRGSTRYRIMFKDREPACGVTTKWKRLRKKKLKVVGSARPTKRGKWTSAEDEALIRRHKAKETFRSIGVSLGRSGASCGSRHCVLTNKRFAPFGGGNQGVPRDRSIHWRSIVARALHEIGGRGTMTAIHKAVENIMTGLLTDRHRAIAPGHTHPRWHLLVSFQLSHSEEFQVTGEFERGEHGHRQHVWVYHAELAPPAPEWEPGEKPRESKFKMQSAKALKAQQNYARAFGGQAGR